VNNEDEELIVRRSKIWGPKERIKVIEKPTASK
jgi:hypothetical protein